MNINFFDIANLLFTEGTKKIDGLDPVGESHTDEKRYERLKQLIELVTHLQANIVEIAWRYHNCHQYSMKRSSQLAEAHIREQVQSLQEFIEELEQEHEENND